MSRICSLAAFVEVDSSFTLLTSLSMEAMESFSLVTSQYAAEIIKKIQYYYPVNTRRYLGVFLTFWTSKKRRVLAGYNPLI